MFMSKCNIRNSSHSKLTITNIFQTFNYLVKFLLYFQYNINYLEITWGVINSYIVEIRSSIDII